MYSKSLLVVVLYLAFLSPLSQALVASSPAAETTRAFLSQALLSPSGKLTFSPEIVIPEPTDTTALLLQANAVQTLSARIRNGKANAAFLECSVTALQTFVFEQENARGKFPGPVPVVYCNSKNRNEAVVGQEELAAIAKAGAAGILVPVCSGKELTSAEDLLNSSSDDKTWIDAYKAALENGLQPVPELTLSEETASNWGEQDLASLVEQLCAAAGAEPVCVLLTVNPTTATTAGADDDEQDNNNKQEQDSVTLPPVPKAIGKTIPILGSVRAKAGDGRLGFEAARFKDFGFTGTVLRSECLPGFRVQLDLEIVSQFWASCISDLKSVKSKNFSFRSKNNMEKSLSSTWAKYQKGIMDSGALGAPEDSYSILDEGAGEYKGFA